MWSWLLFVLVPCALIASVFVAACRVGAEADRRRDLALARERARRTHRLPERQ